MKKLFAMIITLSIVLSFAVVPAHAATFSSDNWVQYERGFKVQTSDFSQNFSEYTDTSYDDEQLTGVRMVGTSTKTLSANKTPVQYYWNSDSFEAGTPDATYAHFRVYLATFSDEYRNAFDYFEMRAISSSGGESNTFMFDVWKIDGTNYDADVYAKSYNNSTAYVTKDWGPLDHQGKVGTDFGNAANNSSNTLSYPSDYDKIDLIMEYNKQSGTTFYLFANGKFMGSWYESTITTKHFNGVSFRVLKDRKIRGNSDYIAVKFDPSRIGHREYYNTSGYYVTLEDVLQDAGLGNTINNDKIMYQTKSGDLQWFMPGNEQTAYHYPNKLINGSTASARVRIGENITYSGTAATITVTNTEDSYALAARMLAGFYPIIGKHGVAYESYHPRAKYVRLSFDQTISNDGMWLEYQTYYSGGVQALQMWNNEGNLVVGIKGGSNITCNGSGSKPTATTTGTNHIDWLLEPDETNNCLNQYVYINNKFAGEGSFGGEYAVRINDIILNTKKAAGTVTIDNWQMTVYNDTADFTDTGLATPQGDALVEIPEPKHENVKVIFTENFEGETAESLANTYPRTTRISDGTCLSYWGTWGSALTTGYNSDTGIFACAGVKSNNSRTCEIYVPADSRPQKGLANIKFNIKPQASISRQSVIMFRTDSYSADDDGKNGILLFENSDISRYVGTWLEVNVWVDLDNDTYQYNIYNTGNQKVIMQGSGTQKFNNLGGFVIKLKGSDSEKDFSEVAPIIDNIYFASADIPDENALRLKTFSFDGATANISLDVGDNVTENADVFMALYSSNMNRLKAFQHQSLTFNNKTKTASASVSAANAETGDVYRLFVWHESALAPICNSIDSRIKVYPNKIANNADFHTPIMRAFLADSNSNCSNYADGTVAAEEPMPITFSWAGDSGCSYVLKVSENSNMSAPWIFETDDCHYDVYNLKVGTRYYWTVGAVKNSETVYTTAVQTFTTIDAAPRNLLIGGSIRNARDIGGWSTVNGKKVKQGLVYRSSALDTWDNDMDRANLCVSTGGIYTMKNLLGIKTEIDFRQGHDKEENFPDGKSTSILGSGVSYYHCPMVAEDYLTKNASSIRTVFGIFANASNYPITYHCAVGADRTGMITYLLNGLLGVSKENLIRDYLLTNFSYQSKFRPPISDSYVATLDAYTGSTLQQKIYNYLSSEIGVPTASLDFIIDYLTE